MPKGPANLTQVRREEIVSACAKLYETMNFKEITIKEIAAFTTFTRTSIYNYFSCSFPPRGVLRAVFSRPVAVHYATSKLNHSLSL